MGPGCGRPTSQAVAEAAASGLMALTGHPGEAPLVPSKDYLGVVGQLCGRLWALSTCLDHPVRAGVELLGERAALMGLERQGQRSPGGKTRLLRSADGYIAVTLARQEDFDCLPAWLGIDAGDAPWEAVERAVRDRPRAALVRDGQLFGIPVSAVHEASGETFDAFKTVAMTPSHRRQRRRRHGNPLVLDFSSLWAGPLCGQLLALAGARVIKVESATRPDGARSHAAFFGLLHQGQEMLALDFRRPQDIAWLRGLIRQADMVIEGSRPRAFEQLGLSPQMCFEANPGLTWTSITAYGRSGPRSNWVGFGDDVAAAAGLIETDGKGLPCLLADAIADPVTGIAAALGTLQSYLAGGGHLVDVAMVNAAAFVAAAPALRFDAVTPVVTRVPDGWTLTFEGVPRPVCPPSARPARGRAAARGAHTAALLREFR